MSQLGQALFTTTQQKVLGLLYAHPEKSFYTKEILRLTGMGVATIKRELDSMVAAGILKTFKIGNQSHYQADQNCPIYVDLLAIVQKTFGMSDIIKTALMPLSDRIVLAFIFGSMANGKETSTSDIDLMIIGELSFFEVVKELYTVQKILSREINPKVYSVQEWQQLCIKNDGFIQDVLKKSVINIVGDGHEFK
jgi:predicted nucleotidyltransferase